MKRQVNEIKSCSLETLIELETQTLRSSCDIYPIVKVHGTVPKRWVNTGCISQYMVTVHLFLPGVHHPHSFSPNLFEACPMSNSKKARFRAAQDTRKNLERAVKMEEYQERRTWESWKRICAVPLFAGFRELYYPVIYIVRRSFRMNPTNQCV